MWRKSAVNLDGVLIPPPQSIDDLAPAQQTAVASEDLASSSSSVCSEPLAEKELKRIAFSLCQYHYEEILPLVMRLAELEDSVGQQEEEGHGGGKGKGGSRGKSTRKG
jgi:hypothetical protein